MKTQQLLKALVIASLVATVPVMQAWAKSPHVAKKEAAAAAANVGTGDSSPEELQSRIDQAQKQIDELKQQKTTIEQQKTDLDNQLKASDQALAEKRKKLDELQKKKK